MTEQQYLEELEYEHGCALTAYMEYAAEHRDYAQEIADEEEAAEELLQFLTSVSRFSDDLDLCMPVITYDWAFNGLDEIPF